MAMPLEGIEGRRYAMMIIVIMFQSRSRSKIVKVQAVSAIKGEESCLV